MSGQYIMNVRSIFIVKESIALIIFIKNNQDLMMNKRKAQQKEPHPLTIMAHDIKAPLTGIVDLLYVIEKGYVTDIEKSKELVHRARVKALGLVKMVDDILDYTLLCNKDNIKMKRVDLHKYYGSTCRPKWCKYLSASRSGTTLYCLRKQNLSSAGI